MNESFEKARLAVIGLGYVGLPLAVEFAKIWPVVGFEQFRALGADGVRNLGKPQHVLYDVKSILPLGAAGARL